ncbi:MAG: hypothetical protein II477_11595 [Lachnospiraceae bacterium]|nr:hypothetical protein [Lachnospiraceae bacterium]
MNDLNQFQCPCCGAKLTYDGEKEMMSCMYCDSTFSMEQVIAEQKAKEEMAAGSEMNWQSSSSSMITDLDGRITGYSCPACGAEMVADENTAATECPYCGNFSIIKTQFDGMYKPNVVVPFAISKEKAQAALGEFTKGKKLLPSSFVNRNRIDSITGLYVPFWLYSCHADGTIYYEGVKTEEWEDEDYRYEKKDHYRMIRSGGMDFQRIPVTASTKMNRDIMDSIEPFDLSKAVEYNAAYFSGYLADRYDIQEVDARPHANERVENTFRDRLKEEVKEYKEIQTTNEQIKLSNAKSEYAMLPVWMMTTEYENQKYTFGINGQTGQLVGSLPIDKSKATKEFVITSAISAVIAIAIICLIQGQFSVLYAIIGVVIALIIGGVRVGTLTAAMNTVHKKTTAKAYMDKASVKLGRREDNFLYSRTEKTAKPKQQTNS